MNATRSPRGRAGLATIAVLIMVLSPSPLSPFRHSAPSVQAAGSCGLGQVAFCETFDAPAGAGTGGLRSGQLNGTLWGVSRTSQDTNPGQGALDVWAPAALAGCGNPTVVPESDNQVCGGRYVEATDDNGGVTVKAAYPKQPFDWANRTGVVTFDVDLNTSGPHGAWPAFAITNLPTPAPYGSASTQASRAQYQLGFSLATTCGAGTDCGANCPYPSPGSVTLDTLYLVNNYAYQAVDFSKLGCVAAQPGTPNHFEVHVSQRQITVWATPPGGGALTELADSGAVSVPFSRGLIWLEDVHYNAAKFGPTNTYTFQWDNVGFDGPVLPRDLAYDVADALTPAAEGNGRVNLGYAVSQETPTTLTVPGLADPQTAQKALLTLNFYAQEAQGFQYQLNGGAWHASGWPYPADDPTYTWHTLALPVALSELHAGQNTVALKLDAADTWAFANLDLILVAAGGTPGGGGPAGGGAPGVVTLTAPAEGSTDVSVTPTLSWTAASGATSSTQYSAYVWDPGASVMAWQGTTGGLSIAVPAGSALQPGHFYFYSVQACNGSTCGPAARWEGFTTAGGLGTPGLVSPVEGSISVSLTPTLQWTAASGASGSTQYTAYVWDPGASVMAWQGTTGGLSIAVPAGSALQPGHFYFYSVQACNGSTCGPSARWEGFTTISQLGTVTLRTPAEGSVGVSIRPTLSWTAVAGATQYTAFIWDPSTGTMVFQGTTAGLSIRVPQDSALDHGHFYFYTVQACADSDCGPSARWEGFTTQ